MDIKRKVMDLASAEGFDRINSLGRWKDYDLFQADTVEPCDIGLPQYILASSKEVRWANVDETEAIMSAAI